MSPQPTTPDKGTQNAVLGSKEYRWYVGKEEYYDIASALQFNLLTVLGLREHHYLLDIGCGSLRAGRLFIPYLRPGRYFGVEPIEWLVKKGVEEEVGQSILDIKRPTFLHSEDFEFGRFGRTFDFLIAQSVFSHMSQAQLRTCLREARQVMTPTSVFAATFFEELTDYTGDHRCVTRAGFTMATIRKLVEEQGLITRTIEWDHQDLQRWILILREDTRVPLLAVNNPVRSIYIEKQLARARQELLELRHHPYVRFGLTIKRSLTWLAFANGRVRRALIGR